jgi:hypothetical protein
MDWAIAIDRQRRQLARIVATLFALVGLAEGAAPERVAKPVYFAALRLLRPAESAVRRLIVAAARGISLAPATTAARAMRPKPAVSRPRKAAPPRAPAFQLFDPLQRFATRYRVGRHAMPLDYHRPQPRIRLIDATFDPRIPFLRRAAEAAQALPKASPPAPEPDDTVSASRLGRRLIAIKSALDDLPRQAMRYARWQARPAGKRRPQRGSALRPGRPPGHRKNPLHRVDRILADCDWLARQAARPDTS